MSVVVKISKKTAQIVIPKSVRNKLRLEGIEKF